MFDVSPNPAPRKPGSRTVDFFASYGLACVLLLCLFVLTLQGTLYQVDHGLYDAKKRYFESFFVWMQFRGVNVPILPGGVTCMALLSVNMIVASVVRFKSTLRYYAVLVVHLGVVFLLFAGLYKLMFAEEGHIQLFEGQEASYFESYHLWEVAIWEIGGEGPVVEHVIGHEHLADLGDGARRTFTSPELPFELILSDYVANSRVLPVDDESTAAGFHLQPMLPDAQHERNVAGLLAEARVGDESQRGLLWGFGPLPFAVRADGRDWAVDLRHARYPMPFRLYLEDFQKTDHPGMMMAKSFQSYVEKRVGDESERILIQMNEPLRAGGLVLYQSTWGPQGGRESDRLFSGFSVVRNHSDRWPEIAMWVITAGLAFAFGRKLILFVDAQSRREGAGGVQ